MSAIQQLADLLPLTEACQLLGLPRASFYRLTRPKPPRDDPKPRSPPPRALSQAERDHLLELLHSPRFLDAAPREIFATLLDEGLYHGNWRTMYRLLAEVGESRERRAHIPRTRYATPQLVARAPNEVWTWDITLLAGPPRRRFYLYVLLDLFSRYVVGWRVAECESEELATALIRKTCERQGIRPGTLRLHSDRGSAMRSLMVSELLEELGVTRSHSRPRVSNDNPDSESQFKTTKYHPDFPGSFESLGEARRFCRSFLGWYNEEHHHVRLALLTPATVYFGRVEAVCRQREAVLEKAYAAHPARFVKGPPQVRRPPSEVWINPPREEQK